ncbi:MAG TPA: DUF3617 domain-containing protein [Opitutales bacterium]|nr:DUF3617 domain-containing protein [Opitutales bacterium]
MPGGSFRDHARRYRHRRWLFRDFLTYVVALGLRLCWDSFSDDGKSTPCPYRVGLQPEFTARRKISFVQIDSSSISAVQSAFRVFINKVFIHKETAMKLFSAIPISSLLLFIGTALAADYPDIKPGLWEHNVEWSTDTGELERSMAEARNQMQKQMKDMSPAQRKMMEDMLAESGMDLGLDNVTRKVCVTEEEIRRAELDFSAEECDQKILSQTSRKIEIEFSCETSSGISKGRGEILLHNEEHYTGQFEFNTEMNGEPTKLTMDQEGRWLGADCVDPGN